MKLSIENIHIILEEFENVEQKPYNPFHCSFCDIEMILGQHFYYCDQCGTIDFDKPVTVVLDTVYEHNAVYLYKRRNYISEKLNLLAGYKQCHRKQYGDIITILEQHKNEFDDIYELRKLMKRCGFHKYYKYIYNIFFEIKKKRLVVLNYNQIYMLTDEFIDIETKFKSSNLISKNMLSYNSIIYYLLKKHNITGWEHLYLAKNHPKVYKQILSITTSM